MALNSFRKCTPMFCLLLCNLFAIKTYNCGQRSFQVQFAEKKFTAIIDQVMIYLQEMENHLAIVMYNLVLKNKAPGYLINLFEKSNYSAYVLQESECRLLLPKYNTEFAKSSSFSFVGTKIWNTLPYHK